MTTRTLVFAARGPLLRAPAADRTPSPGRRRGALAQADGAGRPGPAGGSRVLVVAARRLARAPARHADRPRGDGRDRLSGDADAGDYAGRAVEAQRALRHHRGLQAP